MRIACFALLGLCACAAVSLPTSAVAQAQPARAAQRNADVTIGPGLFSLTELAKTLSTSDAPLHTSPRLGRRIGFVHLKDRSRAEARRLISRAFALSESAAPDKTPGKVWTEERATRQREAAWRDTFAGFLSDEATAVVQDFVALAALEPEALTAETARRSSAEREKAVRGRARTATPDEQRQFIQAVDAAGRARTIQDGWQTGVRASALQTMPFASLVKAAMENGVQSGTLAIGTGDATLQTEYSVQVSVSANGYRLQTVLHDNEWQPVAIYSPYPFQPLDIFFGTDDTPRAPLLGQRAGEWLRGEQTGSEPFLTSPAANAKLTLNPNLPSDAVTARVWQWCAAHKREAIVEVLPSLEAFGDGNAPDTLAGVLRQGGRWSAQDVNGVCIVTSRLAFLGRARTNWEMEGLLGWMRGTVEAAQAGATRPSPFADEESRRDTIRFRDAELPTERVPLERVIAYSRAAWKDKQYTSWSNPGLGVPSLWHTQLDTLDSAALIGALWEMLPPEEQTVPDSRRDVPLSRFSPRAATLLRNWCRAMGIMRGNDADFQTQMVPRMSLSLEPASLPDGARAVRAWIDFPRPDPAAPNRPTAYPGLMLLLDRQH